MTVTEDELAQRRGGRPAGGAEAPETPEPETEEETTETPPEEPPKPKLLQEPLPGDWESISDVFGGANPDMAEIRLLGGKMPIDGSFAKGTEIDLMVRVRITGVLGQDLEDAYGTKGGTVRRHMARMISVRRFGK